MLRSNWLMGQAGRVHLRDAHRLQPAQHAQLGVWIAQAIEDHHANGVLDGRGVAGFAEHAGQRTETQLLPQLIQRPDVTQGERRFEFELRRRSHRARQTLGAQQAVQQRVNTATDFIQPSQRGDRVLPRLAFVVAERLNKLQVAVAAGPRELEVHAPSRAKDANILLAPSIPTIATTINLRRHNQVLDSIGLSSPKQAWNRV